jgi:hypothetical protein
LFTPANELTDIEDYSFSRPLTSHSAGASTDILARQPIGAFLKRVQQSTYLIEFSLFLKTRGKLTDIYY